MQIWDTAGTERYNSMGQNFYRSSEACILVFDLTVKDTFTNIDNWRKDFLSSLGPKDPDTFPFVLVGNKSDMKDDIKVNNEEIEAYCKEHNNMPYYYVVYNMIQFLHLLPLYHLSYHFYFQPKQKGKHQDLLALKKSKILFSNYQY